MIGGEAEASAGWLKFGQWCALFSSFFPFIFQFFLLYESMVGINGQNNMGLLFSSWNTGDNVIDLNENNFLNLRNSCFQILWPVPANGRHERGEPCVPELSTRSS